MKFGAFVLSRMHLICNSVCRVSRANDFHYTGCEVLLTLAASSYRAEGAEACRVSCNVRIESVGDSHYSVRLSRTVHFASLNASFIGIGSIRTGKKTGIS